MILPKNIRQKSVELFAGDRKQQRAFCMGAAFAIGKDLSDFDVTVTEDYPLQEALEMWLVYKKEKNQTYKPSGLKTLKKKLLTMSGGDKEKAMAIVEQSMMNNYAGLFPLREDYQQKRQNYEQKQNANKLADIFG